LCWLKQRGKVYYLYFAKRFGRKPYSLNTSDLRLAREVEAEKNRELYDIVQGIKRPEKLMPIPYSELLRRYRDHKTSQGVDPKTLKNYLKTLNHFGRFLGTDVNIDTITPEQIEAFISFRRRSPKQHGEGTLAPKSLRNEVFTLVNLFTWTTERDFLLNNPMRKVSKPRRVVYDAPRALTYEEYLRLKAAIKSESYADVVDFYLLSGIRRAEGKLITSENFDFENMTLTVAQHKQGTHKVLPIGADLLAVSKRLIERAGVGNPLVTLHVSRLTTYFATARDEAGLPKSITFHSCRHTFASWLAALGTDFKTLQELIGHRSGEATQIYVHAFNPNKRSAIDKLTLPRKAVNA